MGIFLVIILVLLGGGLVAYLVQQWRDKSDKKTVRRNASVWCDQHPGTRDLQALIDKAKDHDTVVITQDYAIRCSLLIQKPITLSGGDDPTRRPTIYMRDNYPTPVIRVGPVPNVMDISTLRDSGCKSVEEWTQYLNEEDSRFLEGVTIKNIRIFGNYEENRFQSEISGQWLTTGSVADALSQDPQKRDTDSIPGYQIRNAWCTHQPEISAYQPDPQTTQLDNKAYRVVRARTDPIDVYPCETTINAADPNLGQKTQFGSACTCVSTEGSLKWSEVKQHEGDDCKKDKGTILDNCYCSNSVLDCNSAVKSSTTSTRYWCAAVDPNPAINNPDSLACRNDFDSDCVCEGTDTACCNVEHSFLMYGNNTVHPYVCTTPCPLKQRCLAPEWTPSGKCGDERRGFWRRYQYPVSCGDLTELDFSMDSLSILTDDTPGQTCSNSPKIDDSWMSAYDKGCVILRSSALILIGCKGTHISNCVIGNGLSSSLELTYGCKDIRISGCHINVSKRAGVTGDGIQSFTMQGCNIEGSDKYTAAVVMTGGEDAMKYQRFIPNDAGNVVLSCCQLPAQGISLNSCNSVFVVGCSSVSQISVFVLPQFSGVELVVASNNKEVSVTVTAPLESFPWNKEMKDDAQFCKQSKGIRYFYWTPGISSSPATGGNLKQPIGSDGYMVYYQMQHHMLRVQCVRDCMYNSDCFGGVQAQNTSYQGCQFYLSPDDTEEKSCLKADDTAKGSSGDGNAMADLLLGGSHQGSCQVGSGYASHWLVQGYPWSALRVAQGASDEPQCGYCLCNNGYVTDTSAKSALPMPHGDAKLDEKNFTNIVGAAYSNAFPTEVSTFKEDFGCPQDNNTCTLRPCASTPPTVSPSIKRPIQIIQGD